MPSWSAEGQTGPLHEALWPPSSPTLKAGPSHMAPADPTLTSEMHGRPTSLEAGVPPTRQAALSGPGSRVARCVGGGPGAGSWQRSRLLKARVPAAYQRIALP